MSLLTRRRIATTLLGLAMATSATAALAQKKYDAGASDTEIKIGNIVPYSGPASAYGVVGKAMGAVFKKVNDEGGINGRKINFISYDDAYSPPKAVEQARKLVESDEVLLLFGTLGTPSNTAIQKYVNSKKVPQLFVATGATKWNDPKAFPWTMGWLPSYQSESRIYAKYLTKEKPTTKIAVLYQNDDMGKDYLKGLKDGFAKDTSRIVAEESYEVSEPTIDSHVVRIKSSNPDVVVFFTTPKFGAQAIKKLGEMSWKPVTIISNVSASTATVMRPAGLENSQGVISAAYAKDASDPQWEGDAGIKAFDAAAGQIFAGGQSRRFLGHDRLQHGDHHGRSVEALRRQSDPRERDEAGREPEAVPARRAAAGRHPLHRAGRLPADRAIAIDAVQGRALAVVRRRHQRRTRPLESG